MNQNKTSYPIENSIIDLSLTAYLTECRYLKSATGIFHNDEKTFNNLEVLGNFSIAKPFYLYNKTGHFNSVEYNICFNQLCYVFFMQVLQNFLINELQSFDIIAYMEEKKQFNREISANNFIVESTAKYLKPIDAEDFYGKLKGIRYFIRKNIVFMKIASEFGDKNGGLANGLTLIAHRNNKLVNYSSRVNDNMLTVES